MEGISFDPCGCLHEKKVGDLVRKFGSLERARKKVHRCVRRCPLARKGKNWMCAHLVLFYKGEKNPRKIIEGACSVIENNADLLAAQNSFNHIFKLISTLDYIRGIEQWRGFSLDDFLPWQNQLWEEIEKAGYYSNDSFFFFVRELLEILRNDVICRVPEDPERTNESKERFDELLLSIHGVLANDLNLIWGRVCSMQSEGVAVT